MSLVVERKRLEQEDGEPLQTVRITPDFDAADQCRGCGVLVVAGEWGLTADNEARFMKPLADFGYFVVGIDLVRGELLAPGKVEEAAKRVATLNYDLAISDIASALLYLKELASGRIGVIGLDIAGAVAMEAATMLPQIDAVVHAGGPPPRKSARLARTRSSMVVHRGTRGGEFTDEIASQLLERVRPSKQTLLTYRYDATPTFYARPLDAEEKDYAEEAWERTRDFFQQQLVMMSPG